MPFQNATGYYGTGCARQSRLPSIGTWHFHTRLLTTPRNPPPKPRRECFVWKFHPDGFVAYPWTYVHTLFFEFMESIPNDHHLGG